MAASACERGHKHFPVEPIKPCFFKVILDEASRVEKIAIPKKFVLKHGEKLADSVSFKIPDGATWKVKLIKTAGGIWLSKGWKEFAKHYSLNRGHLLVFECNTNSSFQVRIFEPSATEMDYQKPNSDQSCQSQSLFDQCGCKRKRSDLDGQSESILKSHRPSEFHIAQPLTQKQRWEALRRASEGFNSENPVFMIAIQPAYLHGKLRVPFRFAKKYLQNITGEVTLQVNQGEPTTVAFILYPEYSHASFNNGWTTFQRENNLKVGDVLIFELIEETKALFNVTVSRATEVVNREAILDCKTEASGFETGNSARTSLRVDRDAEASNSVCKGLIIGTNCQFACKLTAMCVWRFLRHLLKMFAPNHLKKNLTADLQMAESVLEHHTINIHEKNGSYAESNFGFQISQTVGQGCYAANVSPRQFACKLPICKGVS